MNSTVPCKSCGGENFGPVADPGLFTKTGISHELNGCCSMHVPATGFPCVCRPNKKT